MSQTITPTKKTTTIISYYDDLFEEYMGIQRKMLEPFKYKYYLDHCTITNEIYQGLDYLLIRKGGNREARVRKSRVTAIIN